MREPLKRRRRARAGEFICPCNAYPFPHRFGGGKCTGFSIIFEHWHTYWGHCEECQNCNLKNEGECEVMEGRERETECPVWQEFVQYNEIKLYGDLKK